MNPDLLLLDEPFSALDFFTKLRLECEFYQMVKSEQKAAILVTHDIEEAIAMADRVVLLSNQGMFMREYMIDLSGQARSPEEARGLTEFAEYYYQIWTDLKGVMISE